jgi:5-amino-6-(5-phosphoribosylamino)uracil reductase
MDFIHVSVAISLDGFIDDRSPERLILSSPEDFEDMYSHRANCDAILIGAGTVRKDNSSLLFKHQNLIEQRISRGLTPELIKVTLTNTGNLDPTLKFFTTGNTLKIVLCSSQAENLVRERLGRVAEIISVNNLRPVDIISALQSKGIRKLFVEGGTSVLTAFISSGTFHSLRVAVAPFFVGDEQAPRFVGNAKFIHDKDNRLQLVQCRRLGDMTVMDFMHEPKLF